VAIGASHWPPRTYSGLPLRPSPLRRFVRRARGLILLDMPVNIYRLHLRMLNGDMVFPSFEEVLRPLERAIIASARHVEEACASPDEEWASAVIDDECDVAEELLGTSFVVCQAYVTSVVSRVQGLLQHADRQGVQLSSVLPARESVLRTSNSLCASTPFTQVQVLDAFANYFKHRFEWPAVDWSKANKNAQKTIAIVRAVGGSEGSTGNLRTGAESLGNSNYTDLSVFSSILDGWRAGVSSAVEDELASQDLL
jgi:hypothetical protein